MDYLNLIKNKLSDFFSFLMTQSESNCCELKWKNIFLFLFYILLQTFRRDLVELSSASNIQKSWSFLVSQQTVMTVIIFYYYNYWRIFKNSEYSQITGAGIQI